MIYGLTFSYDHDDGQITNYPNAWVALVETVTHPEGEDSSRISIHATFRIYPDRATYEALSEFDKLDGVGSLYTQSFTVQSYDPAETFEGAVWSALLDSGLDWIPASGEREIIADVLPYGWTNGGYDSTRLSRFMDRSHHVRSLSDMDFRLAFGVRFHAIPEWGEGDSEGHVLKWHWYYAGDVEFTIYGEVVPVNGITDPTNPASLCMWTDDDDYTVDDPKTGPKERVRRVKVWAKSGQVYKTFVRTKKYGIDDSLAAGTRRRTNVVNKIRKIALALIIGHYGDIDPTPYASAILQQVGTGLQLFLDAGDATVPAYQLSLAQASGQHAWLNDAAVAALTAPLARWL